MQGSFSRHKLNHPRLKSKRAIWLFLIRVRDETLLVEPRCLFQDQSGAGARALQDASRSPNQPKTVRFWSARAPVPLFTVPRCKICLISLDFVAGLDY
jgi:hypothetical protein